MNLLITKGEAILLIVICAIMVFMCGVLFNATTLKFNDKKMPVLTEDYEFNDDTHFSFNLKNESRPNFWIFSDIIDIGPAIFSIGDLVMLQGLLTIPFLFGVYLYTKVKELKKIKQNDTH